MDWQQIENEIIVYLFNVGTLGLEPKTSSM